MVVALGPGRFYGSGLQRPRFFPDPKLNSYRVDPPLSVTDPLLTWAHEAHWSMGGLSSKRLRLQGRIEGSLAKLRGRRRRQDRQARNGPTAKALKTRVAGQKPAASLDALDSDKETSEEELEVIEEVEEEEEDLDEEDQEEVEEPVVAVKRKRARKLGDEFDRIALAQHQEKDLNVGMGRRTRSKSASPVDVAKKGRKKVGVQKGKKKAAVVAASSRWTSPRRKDLA